MIRILSAQVHDMVPGKSSGLCTRSPYREALGDRLLDLRPYRHSLDGTRPGPSCCAWPLHQDRGNAPEHQRVVKIGKGGLNGLGFEVRWVEKVPRFKIAPFVRSILSTYKVAAFSGLLTFIISSLIISPLVRSQSMIRLFANISRFIISPWVTRRCALLLMPAPPLEFPVPSP